MSGVTDAPFRKLAAELGAGLVVSEMTASDDLAKGRPIARLRCEASGVGPHVVQLAGCETQWMAEGARIAEAAGADIIDINMGCPARHVTNGEAGSALMRDLDHALRLIDATVGAVSVPVTLKMRLGWDHQFDQRTGTGAARGSGRRETDHRSRPHALPVLQGAGGLARSSRRQGCVKIPLVVNGDILSFEDAREALAQSGADAAMIGRGAQGQPWLPGQIGRRLAHGAIETEPPLQTQLEVPAGALRGRA